MIEEEIRDALKELVNEIGAVSARIVTDDDLRTGVPARTLALGGGEYLRVELRTRVERAGSESGREHDIEAAFERTTRQLRAIRRRWEVARLPEVMVAPGHPAPGHRVRERIESFMQALATIDRATNAFVIRGTQLIASAREPDEIEASRWPFLARRALATHAPGSSHGEIVDPDAYAMSFWYDAALVVLLTEPYGIDFVRHRCRQVARELCNLLPDLDPDPDAPAAIGPRPRRPTQP
ncbi:MAG TPA: hypothetical protein VIV40_17025 [Kofleriaceae bacterium]